MRIPIATLLPLMALVAACSGAGAAGALPKGQLPDYVLQSSRDVQEAYRYAVANPDTLRFIPCYCGCYVDGHQSNLDCYVKDLRANGGVVFDAHGAN